MDTKTIDTGRMSFNLFLHINEELSVKEKTLLMILQNKDISSLADLFDSANGMLSVNETLHILARLQEREFISIDFQKNELEIKLRGGERKLNLTNI